MSAEIIKGYVEAFAPIISSFVVIVGFFSTKKMLRNEVDVMLTKFEASTENKAREASASTIANTQTAVSTHIVECSKYRKEFDTKVGEILVAITALSVDIKEHSTMLGMYDSYKAFIREIQQTIHHSVKVLGHDDAVKATKYLLTIYEHIKTMTKYIEESDIVGCDRLVFDAMMEQAICDSKQIAMELGFDVKKIESYFSRKNLSVHSFKKEFFGMISSAGIVNNVSRQYKTLTIRWTEKLCNEFIRHFFIER